MGYYQWERVTATPEPKEDKRRREANKNLMSADWFIELCAQSPSIEITKRQASKYNNGHGAAYRRKNGLES